MTTAQPRSEASRPGHKRLRRSRGRVHVNGAWLAYERVGSGLPVVFVPDLVSDRRVWSEQTIPFGQRYEVIRYDSRGYGKSSLGPHLVRHAEDLASLLDLLGIEQTALVGYEDGAEIALELALDQPERVRALVLAHPQVRDRHRLSTADCVSIEARPQVLLTPAETRALSKAAWRLFVIRMQNVFLEKVRSWPRSRGDRYYPTPWAEIPVSERLAEVRTPTLILRGEGAGHFSWQFVEQLRAAIPGSELASVPGTSMAEPMAAPEAFNRLVLDFLAAHYGPDAPVRDATS
jgi:pimeloyl-ACP methyl ester carboxylesterase